MPSIIAWVFDGTWRGAGPPGISPRTVTKMAAPSRRGVRRVGTTAPAATFFPSIWSVLLRESRRADLHAPQPTLIPTNLEGYIEFSEHPRPQPDGCRP